MSVLKLNVKDLLRRALMVGAVEVRLVPGRRTIVVTEKGENEVRGDPQTPESINAMLEPVMTAGARRGLAAGWTEWEFELPGKGIVRATAELKTGLVQATFFLDRCGNDAPAAAPPREAPSVAIGAMRAPRPAPIPEAFDPGPPETPPLATVPPLPREHQLHGGGLSSGSSEGIDRLLLTMLEQRASDLHISASAAPMLRVDGSMQMIAGGKPLGPEEVQRLLWPIVPTRNREEFTNCHDTDFAYELEGKARFRVNLFVDLHGVGAVLRVIPSKILTVQDLALPEDLLSLCSLPKGLVLVTGPTGSGKSTTLAALIDHINETRRDHVITIEDPIEFVHKNKRCLINQRQVGEHTKSFKSALRAALREDPDIVLLGEMRDLETISIALETAETGHLVFGTLHTSSAPATVDRIIDQFPSNEQNQIRTMLSTSLKGVVSQVLCKKIGGGRVAALEVMFGMPAISNLIREGKIFQIPSIMQTNRNRGMRLLNDSLAQLARDGLISGDEALARSTDKPTLENTLRQHKVPFNS